MSTVGELWYNNCYEDEDTRDDFFKTLLSFMDETETEKDQTSGYESLYSDSSVSVVSCGYSYHFCGTTEKYSERSPIYKTCDSLPNPQVCWSNVSLGSIFTVQEMPTRQVISCANSILLQKESNTDLLVGEFDIELRPSFSKDGPFEINNNDNLNNNNSRVGQSVRSNQRREKLIQSICNSTPINKNIDQSAHDNTSFDENISQSARTSTPLRRNRLSASECSATLRKNELLIMLLRNKHLPELFNHPVIASGIEQSMWMHSSALTVKNVSSPLTKTTNVSSSDESVTSSITQFCDSPQNENLNNVNNDRGVRPRRHGNPSQPEILCRFCFKNGETQRVYTSHVLKADDGTIACPVLQKYTCELCGASGKNSHTRKYCPQFSVNQTENVNKPSFRRLSNGLWTQNLYHK